MRYATGSPARWRAVSSRTRRSSSGGAYSRPSLVSSSRVLLTPKQVSSRASKVVSMTPPCFSSRRISKNKSLYVIAMRCRKVRRTSFLPVAKTAFTPLLLLFLPQTFRWLRKKYFYNYHHASLPFSLGRTNSSERMAHSIMLSSGSLVVKFCIHRPGAVRNWASLLSCTWRPTQRLNS